MEIFGWGLQKNLLLVFALWTRKATRSTLQEQWDKPLFYIWILG